MTMKSGPLTEAGEKTPKTETESLMDTVKLLQQEIKALKESQLNPKNGISSEDLVTAMARFSVESQRTKDKDYRNGIQEEDIPKDDYEDIGTIFCAPFLGYAISDDRRQGHRVLLPYNKESILFTSPHTRRVQNGKEEALSVFSTYMSHSKKETEWLRKHTFFGTMFYESIESVKNFDIEKAKKLSRIMTLVSRFELPQLIARCKEYNVPINQDKDLMRSMVAMKMADVELQSERNSNEARLLDINKERELLMRK